MPQNTNSNDSRMFSNLPNITYVGGKVILVLGALAGIGYGSAYLYKKYSSNNNESIENNLDNDTDSSSGNCSCDKKKE